MDILRTFLSLKSNAKFKNDTVNGFSLKTIAKTYIGIMPTQPEMDAEWLKLNSDDVDFKRKQKIKDEANKRIINLLPPSKQTNFLIRENNIQARISYLQRKEYKNTASVAEIAELDAGESLWIKIEDVRSMSDNAENNNDPITKFISDLVVAGY